MAESVLNLLIRLDDQASPGLGDLGGSLLSIGGLATGAVVGGIAGIGVAALSTASQLQQATNQMQAQLGLTAGEAEALGDVVTAVFGNNFGDSIADAGAGVAALEQQLGLIGTEGPAALQAAAEGAFALRDVFGVELPESANAMNALMGQFGLTSQQALDFLTAGLQGGLNASGDFLETVTEYSNQFAEGGASAAQFFSTLQTGLGTGVLGTDKAGDLFKEFVVRIQDGSALTAESLAMLGLNADQILSSLAAGTMEPIEAFALVQEALRGSGNEAIAMQAGVGLLGTQLEDLGLSAVLGVDLAATSLDDLAGATDSLGVKYNDLGSFLSGVGRQAQVAFLPLGDALLDIANQAAPALQSGFAAIQPAIAAIASGLTSFATAAIPVVVSGLTNLGGILGQVGSVALPLLRAGWEALQPAMQAAGQVLQALGPLFQSLAGQAVGWGANIVNSLAGGIAQAAAAVVGALRQIGAVITSWLRPGSPPRLLPELTDWGAGAASAYMDGWSQADFSALRDLGGQIRGVLEDLVDQGALPEVDLVPTLLGSRDALSQAISEVQEFGRVSDEAFRAVVDAAGPAGPAVEGVLRAYFDLEAASADLQRAQEELAAAQADLNQVTAEYDAILAPLNDALDQNKARQQEIRDTQRIAKLQEDLASGKLDAHEAELAQLEIAAIQMRRQIDATEDERDIAVEASQAKVDAAQAGVDAATAAQQAAQQQLATQKEALQTQRDQNALITEQTQLMARLAEEAAAAAAAAAAGGGGGGGGGGLGALPMPDIAALGNLGADLGQPLAGLGEAITPATEAIQAINQGFADLSATAAAVTQPVTDVGAAVGSIVALLQGGEAAASAETLRPLMDVFGVEGAAGVMAFLAPLQELGGFLQANIVPVIATVAGAIAGSFLPGLLASAGGVGGLMGAVAGLGPAISGAVAAFAAFAAPIAAVALLAGTLATAWQNNFGGIQQTTAGAVSAIGGTLQSLAGLVGAILGQIMAFWQANGADIMAFASTTWTQLSQIVGTAVSIVMVIVTDLANTLTTIFNAIAGFINDHGATIQATLSSAWDFISGAISGALTIIQGIFTSVLGLLTGDWDTFTSGLRTTAEGALGLLESAFQGGLDTIEGIFNLAMEGVREVLQAFVGDADGLGGDIIDGVINGIKGGFTALKNAVQQAAQQALDAAKDFLGIESPSRVFAADVGAPVVQGFAQGMLDNLDVLLDAAAEISWAVLDEAKAFAATIQDAVGPLLADSLQGAADYARGRIRGIDLLGGLAPDTRDLDRLGDQITKIDARMAELRAEAADPKLAAEQASIASRRAALEGRLAGVGADDPRRADLEDELAELDEREAERAARAAEAAAERAAELAELQAERQALAERYQQQDALLRQQRQIQEDAQRAMQEAQRQAAALSNPAERAAFLAERLDAISEEASLRQRIAGETNAHERALLEEQLGYLQEAQAAEFALYAAGAQERQAAQRAALRDAEDAIKQLGNLVFYTQQDVFGVGSDAIRGIAEGMLSQATLLSETLGGVLADALKAAKAELGIASPARVPGQEIGVPFVQGIEQAVLRGRQDLADAATTAVGGLLVPPPVLEPRVAAPVGGALPGLGPAGPGLASADDGAAGAVVVNFYGPITVGGQAADEAFRRAMRRIAQEELAEVARRLDVNRTMAGRR